jgi:hypothetical protein
MSGYRQHNYDPNAYEQPGKPMTPYNWVQWTGIAIGCIGLVLTVLQVAGQLGWIPQWLGDTPPVFVLLLLGVILVNSRREPPTEAGSEQLAKNRRLLLITFAVCAVILGAAALIEFQGA